MNIYLDTSVVLRRFLQHPLSIRSWGTWDRVYFNRLVRIETVRALDRLRLEGHLDDHGRVDLLKQLNQLCEAAYLVPLTDAIVARAEQPFPTIIGTLDAIHLSTAIILREQEGLELTMVTHDRQLGLAAETMNFQVEGI